MTVLQENDALCSTCDQEKTVKCILAIENSFHSNLPAGDCRYVQIYNYNEFIGADHLIC
jgi:hypothetical protein